MEDNNYSEIILDCANEIQKDYFEFSTYMKDLNPNLVIDDIKDIFFFTEIAKLRQEIEKLKQFKKDYGFI